MLKIVETGTAESIFSKENCNLVCTKSKNLRRKSKFPIRLKDFLILWVKQIVQIFYQQSHPCIFKKGVSHNNMKK